jgi:hypothetical protein
MKGRRVTPQRWDVYVMLADSYHWTPQEVDAMDPDFIDELLAFRSAQVILSKKNAD